MDPDALNEHRRTRLAELLQHPKFGGKKVALGKALGYADGAFVRQMIAGERPITEKTIARIHAIHGFAGWMDAQPGTAPTAASLVPPAALAAGEPMRAYRGTQVGTLLARISELLQELPLTERRAVADLAALMLQSGQVEPYAQTINSISATVTASGPGPEASWRATAKGLADAVKDPNERLICQRLVLLADKMHAERTNQPLEVSYSAAKEVVSG